MVGGHVCDPPMALEGLLLCNEAFQAHPEGSSAHTASVVPVHSREWEEEEGEPQGGGHGIQTASHQQNKNLQWNDNKMLQFCPGSLRVKLASL